MNLLSRLLGRSECQIDDPVFGPLRQKKAWWEGEASWPQSASRVTVSVHRSPGEPSAEDRNAFLSVRDGYNSLLPAISEALFRLWGKPDAKWDGPNPSSPQELLQLLELSCVFVEPSARVELLYGFAGEVWPDAMLTVAVQAGTVEPVSFDD